MKAWQSVLHPTAELAVNGVDFVVVKCNEKEAVLSPLAEVADGEYWGRNFTIGEYIQHGNQWFVVALLKADKPALVLREAAPPPENQMLQIGMGILNGGDG